MTDQNICFLIETIHDDSLKKVALRATARRNLANKLPVTTRESIIELLTQRKYGKYYLFEEVIKSVIADLAQRLEALKSGSALYDDIFETPIIAEARDAIAEVRISDDSLKAYINLTPARGGKQLDLDSAKMLLKENGVVYGEDKQLLFDLIQAANKSETGEPIEMLVALAKDPIEGEDTQFIPLVETANERILKPQLREDGTIDMRELGNLPIVKTNEVIMRKQPFTLGINGLNVRGEAIEAQPGKDFDFVLAPGTMINPTNSNELIAEINGQPNLTNQGMKVENVIKVKAVDLSTGNIDIDANLLVEGDITESMRVYCTGNITVGGVIESADVRAGGSIFVGKGIVGHIPHHKKGIEDKLTVFVKAGHKINAVFASYAHLEAEDEIHMDEQLLHCDSTSNGKITIGCEKTVGSQIIGGIARSKEIIEADVLGSYAGILTRFDLSALYIEKQQDINEFEHNIEDKNNQINSLIDTYKKFTSHQLNSEQQEKANKIKNTVLHLKKSTAELESKAETMRQARDIALQQLKVIGKRRIHPLVEVQMGNRKFRSNRVMESGKISLHEGDIRYQAENFDNKK